MLAAPPLSPAPRTSAIRPFRLDVQFADPLRQRLFDFVAPAIEHLSGLSALNDIYAAVGPRADAAAFAARALELLNVAYDVSPTDLARIPRKGPVVVVANHPFGGLDGVILCALLRQIRPDAKVMANYLLSRIPELRDLFFFVDPFGGKDAARANVRALRQSIEHVQEGGLLAVFPAGEVSHMDMNKRSVMDGPWSDTVARIVRKTGASVLPVFFAGGNSRLFQVLGMVHPRLRTAMLPRELLNKKRSRVTLRIGNAIAPRKLATFTTDEDLTAYLRLRTYLQQLRETPAEKPQSELAAKVGKAPVTVQPIAPARDAAVIAAEVGALRAEALLADHPEFAVYIARAGEIPNLLHEIGRQREITFRGVAEGTGKPLDLDRFDQHYLHLFCFHKVKRELVGAYRLGLSDEILRRYGVEGFYTSTLFQFQRRVLEQISPAIELGRSFVRPEYQRAYAPLLLLWKGIGQFVVRHPQYLRLFGPVSINNDYNSASRQLIAAFLAANNAATGLAEGVKPRNPLAIRPPRSMDLKACSTVVRDTDEISDLVAEIESDQKGVPILLKQYMKLGAKILGFNVDPDFGQCLDGLVLVDLTTADPRIIERFAGAEGARVLAAHLPRGR